jgi:deoxyribodipyrimidine photolyase-related protein
VLSVFLQCVPSAVGWQLVWQRMARVSIAMNTPRLLLILGDQLSFANPVLRHADPERDVILLAEVAEEAGYVPHNRHKIVLLFSAMRHFAAALESKGYRVIYRRLSDGVTSLEAACKAALETTGCQSVEVCAPGEHRLWSAMQRWSERLSVPVSIHDDDRFLASIADFRHWAAGRKQLRMEYFYREMRKRYGLLLDDGEPAGGKWNYDADNRVGWRGQEPIPARRQHAPDAITRAVIAEVAEAFPDNPGELSRFRLAVTHEGAQADFDWFLEHALSRFGTYQDALVDDDRWVFHSLISMYLNCGLLEPLPVCQAVEARYRAGDCSLAAAEGFIRQILGWREYVRGVYWLLMPEYAERNTFSAERPLPEWFWNAETDLRCLSRAIGQSLDDGYAHHIQRLMVIGNFALLAGLDVKAVCEWYLAVYVDAYEWVELPNTAGMALHADNGAMASKPYAASGKYIQKQGDHCKQCRFNPAKMTGEDACPFNSLYWRFIDRHQDYLEKNARMGLILANWRKRDSASREAILAWAEHCLERFA